jgi:hypothetical protein
MQFNPLSFTPSPSPSSDQSTIPPLPKIITLHAVDDYKIPDLMDETEIDKFYHQICRVTTTQPSPPPPPPPSMSQISIPLKNISIQQEISRLNNKLYENHHEHLMLQMCDCAAGSILGYIRDHSLESYNQGQFYTVITSIAKCLLQCRKERKCCDISIEVEKEPILTEEEEEKREREDSRVATLTIWNHGDGDDENLKHTFSFPISYVSLIHRFLFNANPISYGRMVSKYEGEEDRKLSKFPSSLTDIIHQFEWFQKEYDEHHK